MSNQTRSSTRNDHANEPRADAQRSNNGAQPSTPAGAEITSERKKYLAATYGLSAEQVDVVRNVICPSATDSELEFFLATCKRVKLDPFSRQIFFIKRKQKVEDQWGNANWIDVGRPEVSIDGLRSGAEQTGDYEGQGPVMWCGADGKWVDVWISKDAPHAAKATIFRRGHREPLVNVALFDEYVPRYKNGGIPDMWKRMPANQLAKCAEAGGLRRAFPRDLSGLYTDVEMEQASAQASYAAPTAKPSNVIDVGDTHQLGAGERGPIATLTDADRADIDGMLKSIEGATERNALAPIGARITAARKKKEENRSPIEREIIETIVPKLEEKWRSLPVGAKS